MAKAIIYLPTPPTLECGGNIAKSLEKYFKTMGSTIVQLKLQASFVEGDCGREFFQAIATAEAILDEITGLLMTDVFTSIKNKVDEMEYKVREFMKDIDVWLQKKIIEAAMKLLSLLGIPNPLALPIPFMSSVEIIGADGNPQNYKPVIGDMFTKEGKMRVKAAMKKTVANVKKFFGDDPSNDVYAGEWNIKSLDHEVEETWQKLVHEINKILNATIIDLINALFKALTKIPIIGSLIKALGAFIDPTKTLDQMFKDAWNKAKKKYQEIRDKLISGELESEVAEKLMEEANKIIDTLINTLLGIKVPLFGTLGDIIGINPEKDFKKYKVQSKEKILGRIRDGWNDLMEKIKKFLATDWIAKMYKLVMKLPGWLLKRFPIIGKIIKFCEMIIDILTGKIDPCFVMRIILPQIFNLASLITKALPTNCIEIRYTEYGFMPGMTEEEQRAEALVNGVQDLIDASNQVHYLPQDPIPPATPMGTTTTDDNGNVTAYSDSTSSLSIFKYAGSEMQSYVETATATGKMTQYVFSGSGDNVTTTTIPIKAIIDGVPIPE